MEALDGAIAAHKAGGFVGYGSSQNPDILYLTRFQTGDPVVYVKRPGEGGVLVVSQMEVPRASREARCAVISRAEAGLPAILKEEQDPWRAIARMITGLVRGKVLFSPSAPCILAKEIAALTEISVDKGTVEHIRAVKRDDEIAQIQAVQTVNGAAMRMAQGIIRRSRIEGENLLHRGSPLTSEYIRGVIQRRLLAGGCHGRDIIVSCGADTAIPHSVGSGPLVPGEPIVIDIAPRDEKSGYHSDMTRTVVRGEAAPQIKDMFRAVQEARDRSIARIKEGVRGDDLHQEVCDHFQDMGFSGVQGGFIHNLGHGVGLAVHEHPSLGPGGGPLAAGNVITVEPGLYLQGVGGVRIEEIGLVVRNGFQPFTRRERDLQL
ncbi:MAG: Xaa-Pro peptidase family protein [Methanomicrobiales archaeon]|jgi:Xaa-Pro aminopeptidase|nr:Xaa-Pro peptidase family protein [Methanomicrobiales archaeon]